MNLYIFFIKQLPRTCFTAVGGNLRIIPSIQIKINENNNYHGMPINLNLGHKNVAGLNLLQPQAELVINVQQLK